MSILSKTPVPWPVPWIPGQKFFFRVGDVIERSNLEAELAGEHRAGRVYNFELEMAFGQGIETLLKDSPDDAAQLAQLQQAAAAGDELAIAEAAQLEQARDLLAEHWPPYRALKAKLERRNGLIPILAFRRFCTGWEGEGLPVFARGPDGLVTMECMAAVEPLAITAAGSFAYSLLYGGDKESEKNSGPPSKSGGDRKTSASATPRGAGKSAGTAGRKTRSSRSPRRSSRSSTSGSTAKG